MGDHDRLLELVPGPVLVSSSAAASPPHLHPHTHFFHQPTLPGPTSPFPSLSYSSCHIRSTHPPTKVPYFPALLHTILQSHPLSKRTFLSSFFCKSQTARHTTRKKTPFSFSHRKQASNPSSTIPPSTLGSSPPFQSSSSTSPLRMPCFHSCLRATPFPRFPF